MNAKRVVRVPTAEGVPHRLRSARSRDDARRINAEFVRRALDFIRRQVNICSGCDSPYRPEQHVYGQSKCCPDCSHRAPDSGRAVR